MKILYPDQLKGEIGPGQNVMKLKKSCIYALIIGISILLWGVNTAMASNPVPIEENNIITWTSYPWGELGVTHLAHAPYPDDSRANGFQTKDTTYGVENHYDDNAVAILVPNGFKPTKNVDIVVLFHGHVNEAAKFITDYQVGKWFSDARKNAILVVPQGPKNAPDSGGGKMEKPRNFEYLMNEVISVLKTNGTIALNARLGNVIVGGYSGGYRPVAYVLHLGGIPESIKEVWLFDAAYDFQDYLAKPFAKEKDSSDRVRPLLRTIFTDHLMPEHVKIMSYLTQYNKPVSVLEENQLTISTTMYERLKTFPIYGTEIKIGNDQLSEYLKTEKHLFIHTVLPHDGVAFSKRFLGSFVQNSPNLKPIE
jgi:hypothetical protein